MNLIQKQRDRKSVKSIVRNNHKKSIQDFVVYSILYSSFIQSFREIIFTFVLHPLRDFVCGIELPTYVEITSVPITYHYIVTMRN